MSQDAMKRTNQGKLGFYISLSVYFLWLIFLAWVSYRVLS